MDNVSENEQRVIREPKVAGAFYPADAAVLTEMVDRMIEAAAAPDVEGKLLAVFSPHAGYSYSGQTAAHAYKLLKGRKFETVVIVAPSHHAYFDGVSVYDRGPYKTPLGLVEIDRALIDRLEASNGLVRYVPQAHSDEHSLEVQLPFLQRVLKDFKLVPMIMGDQGLDTCRRLGELLAETTAGESVLVVASSDLYHGYDYGECRRVDANTLKTIEAFDVDGLARGLAGKEMMACGGGPIMAAMVFGRKLGADRILIVDRTNSGDVTGDKQGYIVGYAAGLIIDTE